MKKLLNVALLGLIVFGMAGCEPSETSEPSEKLLSEEIAKAYSGLSVYDRNDDGIVSPADFVIAKKEGREELLKDIQYYVMNWDRLDLNKDGYVDFSDYSLALEKEE